MKDINLARRVCDEDLAIMKERVKDFRPIDDVFFEVFINDIPCCQEILRVILEDDDLTVTDIIVQSSERNLYGRSVRLDALCVLGNGKKCNIEVQRADNDDHLKRVRFNASSITVKDSKVGSKFSKIEDIIVIYISQFDIFKSNKTIYHIDNVIRETGDCVNDGLERIFVNTEIKDGSDIAELMSCFKMTTFNNPKFPAASNRMNYIKNSRGGLNSMCDVMERYLEECRKEEQEKTARLVREEREKSIKIMIQSGMSIELIAEGFDMPIEDVKQIAAE